MGDLSENELAMAVLAIVRGKNPSSVEEIIQFVQAELAVDEDRILASVLKLIDEGKIRLYEQKSLYPQDLSEFLRSVHALWYWLVLSIVVVTFILSFLVVDESSLLIYFRYGFGMVFSLFLPGYAFTKALFPVELPIKSESQGLSFLERVALGLGLSLVFTSLFGALLNFTPWGIRSIPLIVVLSLLIFLLATLGVVREFGYRNRGA